MSAAQIVFALLLCGAVGYTVWGFPRRYGALSGRSRLFRVAGLLLIDLLLVLVLIYLGRHFEGRIGMIQRLAFFASFLALVFSVVCTALLDALESFSVLRREEKAVMQQAIEESMRQKNIQ